MKDTNFFFFGDSISFGQFVSPHKTWVSMVSKDIHEKLDKFNVRIINASISGNTTRMALERMPYDLQSHGIDYLVIEFGMNDCNCWLDHRGLARVSEAAFQANLEEIIDRGLVFGAKKVFILTNHPTPKTEQWSFIDTSYQAQNEKYNNIIRRVSKAKSIVLIDIENSWKNDNNIMANLNSYLLNDGIHLNELGHKSYYKSLKDKLIMNL